MRAELEPLIDEINEEDIFGAEDEQNNLSRILFVRKMGIYVEVQILFANIVLCKGWDFMDTCSFTQTNVV